MVNLEGLNLPTVNITGFLSSTWIYVVIVVLLGVFLIIGVALLLFFKTYNKKIVFFENISGLGYQPVMRKRARTLKVGNGGEELLALIGGETISAYGRKMGKNTYWFAKGSDGYWYNFLLADLDTKMAMLDINPIDRDVRMFHVAKDRMNRDKYLKRTFMEKYGVGILMFIFLIVLIFGMWFIVGKIGNATQALVETSKANVEVIKTTRELLQMNENIKTGGVSGAVSGLVPVN